jgi:hypothetical protein
MQIQLPASGSYRNVLKAYSGKKDWNARRSVVTFTLPSSLPAATVLTPLATTEEQADEAPKLSYIQTIRIRPIKGVPSGM